ncbi:hypothetical protein R1sor_007353 [Riccia sorocarpa]|uniref:Uncharacterized protein n=1 Tax=Riccia sorocarpa TaxID=122646 RepID=A0ABD3HTQ0_9MARC
MKSAMGDLKKDLQKSRQQSDELTAELRTQFRVVSEEVDVYKTALLSLQVDSKIIRSAVTLIQKTDLVQVKDQLTILSESVTSLDKAGPQNTDSALAKLNTQISTSLKSVEQKLEEERLTVKTVVSQLEKCSADLASQSRQLQEAITHRPPSDTNMRTVMDTLDGKFQTFITSSRGAQEELHHEREREKEARASRSLNLRIVGIPESEDEDTKLATLEFFRDTLRVVRPEVVSATRVGKVDVGSRTVLVRFPNREAKEMVLANRGMLKGMKNTDPNDVDDAKWKRRSEDAGRNSFTEKFLQLITICDLTVMSGISSFPETEFFTCYTPNGASVVDYLAVSKEAREWISSFTLGQLVFNGRPERLFVVLVVWERNGSMKNASLPEDGRYRLQLTHGKRSSERIKVWLKPNEDATYVSYKFVCHENLCLTLRHFGKD